MLDGVNKANDIVNNALGFLFSPLPLKDGDSPPCTSPPTLGTCPLNYAPPQPCCLQMNEGGVGEEQLEPPTADSHSPAEKNLWLQVPAWCLLYPAPCSGSFVHL